MARENYWDIDSLTDEILGENYESERQQYIQQLKLKYQNLSDSNPHKKDLWKLISYYEYWEESWVTTNEFIELNNKLWRKWIIKDDSWEKLWQELNDWRTEQERISDWNSRKISNIFGDQQSDI